MKRVGKIKSDVKNLLNINTDIDDVLMSDGFIKHLDKRNHSNMYSYLDKIEEIIANPDYVGVNPREKDISLEYVKLFNDNVLVGIKLDVKNNYFYTATMHEISNLKLSQRIKNGRLKRFDKN